MGNFVSSTPNEAVLISGIRGTRVVVGSTTWRFWVVDTVNRLSLQIIQLELHSIGAETVHGVKVNVTAVATVRVRARNESSEAIQPLDKKTILLAAQQFGGKNEDEIHNLLKQALEGLQRQILGTLTVEQVFRDRASFSARVREHHEDLEKMGFEVVSYSIKDITDENGYMEALGATQTAIVKREAAEGQAKNSSEARQKVAAAESTATIFAAKATREAHVSANAQNELQVESDKNVEMKKADTSLEIGQAKQRVELALQTQKKMTETQVAEQEAIRLKVEADGQAKARMVAAEAESERDRVMTEQHARKLRLEAEGQAKARLIAAEADAQKIRILARAEADAVLVRNEAAKAEAERIQILAEAEANAIRVKGEAEAARIRAQAEAYNAFGQAALSHMLINKLPEIAAEIAKPLAKTDKITFISSGGEGGGPSALTRDVTTILAQLPQTVQALTGFDLSQAIQGVPADQEKSGMVTKRNGSALLGKDATVVM